MSPLLPRPSFFFLWDLQTRSLCLSLEGDAAGCVGIGIFNVNYFDRGARAASPAAVTGSCSCKMACRFCIALDREGVEDSAGRAASAPSFAFFLTFSFRRFFCFYDRFTCSAGSCVISAERSALTVSGTGGSGDGDGGGGGGGRWSAFSFAEALHGVAERRASSNDASVESLGCVGGGSAMGAPTAASWNVLKLGGGGRVG
jgi:hypothetical protein